MVTENDAEWLHSNGIKLRVRQWNQGKSPTLVLVDGYPDSSHVWDKTVALLAQDYHVAVYDVRGAGESDAPKHKNAYKLEHLAADFRAVIDFVSPEAPIHLVAHDWGSIQCWEPVTNPDFAGRIASYTSISGPCLDHVGHWIAQRLRSRKPGEIGKVANQLLHSWYVAAFHLPVLAPALWRNGLDKLWPSLLRRVEGVADAQPSETQREDGAMGVNLYRANFFSCLFSPRERHTEVPVQLLVPIKDNYASPQLYEDLHQWVPKFWRFDINAGHWLPLSRPDMVAQYVSQFVDFIEAGADQNKASSALRRARVGLTV